MAGATARIPECLPCYGNKLPVVAVGMQSQFQNSEGIGVADFTVSDRLGENPMAILSARARDEFANAARVIEMSLRVLRSKPLVIVVMAVNHNVRASRVQCLPALAEMSLHSLRRRHTRYS